MNRLARYLMPFAAAAMLAGCGVKESFKEASVEVCHFQAALDADDWPSLWTQADPQLRKAAPRVQFGKLLQAVHRKGDGANLLGSATTSSRST